MEAGALSPPLLFADDMRLLVTPAEGLRQQLQLLERYCRRYGLVVNLAKNLQCMLLAGSSSAADALQHTQREHFTYDGTQLPATAQFKHLGVVAAAPAAALSVRSARSHSAVCSSNHACTQGHSTGDPQAVAQPLHHLCQRHTQLVAAVWAPGMAAQAAERLVVARGKGISSTESEPELQHRRFLRQVLGLPHHTPATTLLAVAG